MHNIYMHTLFITLYSKYTYIHCPGVVARNSNMTCPGSNILTVTYLYDYTVQIYVHIHTRQQ